MASQKRRDEEFEKTASDTAGTVESVVETLQVEGKIDDDDAEALFGGWE